MPELKKLAGLTHISQSQEQVVEHLWRMTGACCGCGTTLTERSAKSAVGIINTRYCAIQEVRNTIGITLYCGPCTGKLSMLLKQMRAPTNLGAPKINGQN